MSAKKLLEMVGLGSGKAARRGELRLLELHKDFWACETEASL